MLAAALSCHAAWSLPRARRWQDRAVAEHGCAELNYRCLLTPNCSSAQTTNSDKDGRPFKYLYEPIKERFVVVVSRLKIFIENALGLADGFNGDFLIAHVQELHG